MWSVRLRKANSNNLQLKKKIIKKTVCNTTVLEKDNVSIRS